MKHNRNSSYAVIAKDVNQNTQVELFGFGAFGLNIVAPLMFRNTRCGVFNDLAQIVLSGLAAMNLNGTTDTPEQRCLTAHWRKRGDCDGHRERQREDETREDLEKFVLAAKGTRRPKYRSRIATCGRNRFGLTFLLTTCYPLEGGPKTLPTCTG